MLAFILYGYLASPVTLILMMALFFFGGVQLFFMGLLDEFIFAIYGQVRRKPLVIERERIYVALPPTADKSTEPKTRSQ